MDHMDPKELCLNYLQRDKRFFLSSLNRPGLLWGPPSPLLDKYPLGPCSPPPKVNRPQRDVDHSPWCNADVRNE